MKSNKTYYRPRGYTAYTPLEIIEWTSVAATEHDGSWIPARPEPFPSFIDRLKQAWDVLTYRADALYWGIRDKNEVVR